MGSHSDRDRRHHRESDRTDRRDRDRDDRRDRDREDKYDRDRKDRHKKDRSSSKRYFQKRNQPVSFSLLTFSHNRHRDRSADKDKHKKKKEKKPSYDDEEPTHSDLRPSLDDLGYSNVNNPFNDINLENKFVWGKKNHRDKKELGLSSNDLRQRERERKREADDELAKLNKRRAEREREIELREEEMARIQRDAELAQMGDWEAKEEEVKRRMSLYIYTHLCEIVSFGTSKTKSRNPNQRRKSQAHRYIGNEPSIGQRTRQGGRRD